MPKYWLSVEKVILLINWITCSFYEGILYLIKGCAHRTFNKNLATKHYSQNRRFWVRGRGKIIPTISMVSFFIPTVKFPRLRCIQFVRSFSFMGNRRAKHLDEMVKEKSSSDLRKSLMVTKTSFQSFVWEHTDVRTGRRMVVPLLNPARILVTVCCGCFGIWRSLECWTEVTTWTGSRSSDSTPPSRKEK